MQKFNTGETPKELKEIYNPDGSALRKAQLKMLDMLIYIDRICKEQSINYRLDGGNVLGAIRHSGFIPWDDDVDIVLTIEEYNRLCSYLKKFPHPTYALQCFETDPGYVGAFSVLRDTKSEIIKEDPIHRRYKYRGIAIDIFPCENRIIKPFHWLTARMNNFTLSYLSKKNLKLARIIHWIQFAILHPIFRFLGFFVGKSNVYMYSYGINSKVQFEEKVILPPTPIVFEGKTFMGPANVKEYLRLLYGDYMSLPTKNNRNKHSIDDVEYFE